MSRFPSKTPPPPSADMTREPLLRAQAARGDLRQAMMTAVCGVLHGTQLPPMTVLQLAAEALGSIYAEVADAHGSDTACPCGWHACAEADIRVLQAALASAVPSAPRIDLRMVEVAGRS